MPACAEGYAHAHAAPKNNRYSHEQSCFSFLHICTDTSREKVINKSNKYKKESILYPINSNLEVNNKSKHSNRKKKKFNNSDLFSEKEDNKNNKKDVNGAGKSSFLENESFTSLKGDNSNIDENTLTSSNNMENVYTIMDYIEIIDDKGNLTFSLHPFRVDINTCKEIIRFTNNDQSDDNNINSIFEKKFYDVNHYMELNAITCSHQKSNLLNIMNVLENPTTTINPNELENFTLSSYNRNKNEFVECLKRYNDEITKKLEKAKAETEKEYGDKYCHETCNANVYFEKVRLYISQLNDNYNKMYNADLGIANDFVKTTSTMISLVESEFGDNRTVNTLKFVQGQIKDIIKSYNYHINNIKNAEEKVREHENTDKSTSFDKTSLVQKTVDLAKHMADYNFSNEMFNRLKRLYAIKKNKFHLIFIFLVGELEKKINTFVESDDFQQNYDSIIVQWKNALASARDIYSVNSDKAENFENNGSLEAIIIKNKKSLLGELKNEIKAEAYDEDYIEVLIKLLETVCSKKKTINDNISDIYKNYSSFKNIETEVEELKSSIERYFEEIKQLKSKGVKRDAIREEIITKMASITENVSNFKKIIALEEKAKEHIAQIDEIATGTSLNLNEYITKKNNEHANIKSKMGEIYTGDLKKFVNELSLNIDENRNNINLVHSTDALNDVLEKTRQDFDRLKDVKCDDISVIISSITQEVNTILDVKENILRTLYGHMNDQLTNTLRHFKKTYDELVININDYASEKERMDQYKDIMDKREKEFVYHLHGIDEDVSEGKNSYRQFLILFDALLKKTNKISVDINSTKEALKNAKIQLLLYMGVPESFNIITGAKEHDIIDLIEEINDETMDKNISFHENGFITYKEIINKVREDIETSEKNINNLKILNNAINDCNKDNASIEELVQNKKTLKDRIFEEKKNIQTNKFMEQHISMSLEIKLNETLINVENKLNDSYIRNLKKQMQNILGYYTKSKEMYKTLNVLDLAKIKENHEWENVKDLTNDLSVEYKILKKSFDDLVMNKNDEIIKCLDISIANKNKEINEKVNEYVHNLEQISKKLESPYFKKNEFSLKQSSNKEILDQFNDEIKQYIQNINGQKDKLYAFKRQSSDYITKKNEKKDEDIKFDDKKKAIEEIHDGITSTYEQLNVALEKIYTSKDIDNLEFKYDKALIDNVAEKIRKEKEKSTMIMQEINLHIDAISGIKGDAFSELKSAIDALKYEQFLEKGKQIFKDIENVSQNSDALKQKIDNNREISEIRAAKENVDNNLQAILKKNKSLQEVLDDIKNMKEVLSSSDFKSITNDIKGDTVEAQKYSSLAKGELAKSDALVKEVKENYGKADDLKKAINATLDERQIEQKMEQIIRYKDEIFKRKEDIITYLKNVEGYKEMSLLYLRNATRRKDRIQFLREHKREDYNGDNNILESDIREANENVEKCENLSGEVANDEMKIKGHVQDYTEHEKKIGELLTEASVLEIKSKYERKINKASSIVSYITQVHKQIEDNLRDYEQKLNKFKEESQINEKREVINNEKSKEAYSGVKFNLGLVEYNISNIKDIRENIKKILAKVTNSKDSIFGKSRLNTDSSLDKLKEEEIYYIGYLKNIENIKIIMDSEKDKTNAIKDNVAKIEKELEENKKKYEEGLLEKMKETADEKKRFVETAKESISLLKDYFNSLVNEFDLKMYNFKEKLEEYQSSINKIHTEFKTSYNVLENNAKSVVRENVKYDAAKKLREEAQRAEASINDKEIFARRDLNNIKKNESVRIIYYIKEHLDKINKKCEEEHSQVEESYKVIKGFIENIKKLNDEEMSKDKLKKAIQINDQMKKTTHSCYKNEAQNIFGKIIKSANLIGIKIISGVRTELTPQVHLETKVRLNSELKFESEIEMEEDLYKNIQLSYRDIIKTFKYSEDVDKKQEECERWIREGKDICHETESTNELKLRFTDTKNRGTVVLYKIFDALGKFNELNEIICSNENHDMLLENSEYEKLKELSSAYNTKKNNSAKESEINKLKEEYESYMLLLHSLEKQVDTTKEYEQSGENLPGENTSNISITEIDRKIDEIDEKITKIINSLDELLMTGNECAVLWYDALIGNINIKISNDLRTINNKKESAEKYVEYVKNNTNSINGQISAINKSYNSNVLTAYPVANSNGAITHFKDLNIHANEATEIINDIKKEVVGANVEIKINTLNGSKESVLQNYDRLKEKVKLINNIYKEIDLLKLKEMEESASKYFDVAKILYGMTETQKSKLLDNEMELRNIEEHVRKKQLELNDIDEEYSEKCIHNFYEIYMNIVTNMKRVKELEEENKREDRHAKADIESIFNLINKANELVLDVNDYENNYGNNMIKEHGYVVNSENMHIEKMKDEIDNAIGELEKALDNVKENTGWVSSNDGVMNTIYDTWKSVLSIKESFSNNIPVKKNIFRIEDYLKDIKYIFNETNDDDNIDEYIKTVSEDIENKMNSIEDNDNGEEIQKVMESINKYKEQTKGKILILKDLLQKITKKKEEMDNIFIANSVNMNKRIYTFTEEYINEAQNLINNLRLDTDKMEVLAKDIEIKIKHMEERGYTLGHKNANNVFNNGDIIAGKTVEELQNLYDLEKGSKSNYYPNYSKSNEDNSLHKIRGITPINKNYENMNDSSQNEDLSYDNISNEGRGRNEGGRFGFAGGSLLGLAILSSVGFFIYNTNEVKEEQEEADFKTSNENFSDYNESNSQEKDEIIEVVFNECNL
ncbi:reticulocyte binding protein 3 (RBP3), pseudogene [Plasmodium ovale wallikeri]|nr:reticulocyte binding protein 3 (RBP3), pseudogene [Plasmodium ovale wallikeri]